MAVRGPYWLRESRSWRCRADECDRHTAADPRTGAKLELQDQLYARTRATIARDGESQRGSTSSASASKGPKHSASRGARTCVLATLAHECEIEVPLVCIAAPGYENPHNSS